MAQGTRVSNGLLYWRKAAKSAVLKHDHALDFAFCADSDFSVLANFALRRSWSNCLSRRRRLVFVGSTGSSSKTALPKCREAFSSGKAEMGKGGIEGVEEAEDWRRN